MSAKKNEEKNEKEGSSFSFPKMEEEILEFWEANKIFEKSVEQRKKGQPFVFYEGPPTANNIPHMGHFETRVFKDVILRYKTMRGFYAPRRAGWDTHGLPVEVEVEKRLGIKNKKEIEEYGVAEFNKKCRESVWQYKELWEKMTSRMGFWIDMGRPYITYENSYIESLWAIIKKFSDNKYLYEDYKVVPWCARCGTALSSHEVAQGYEKVKEESVYVKFKVKAEGDWAGTSFLVWTTTPWTLPGNVALAVNPKIEYVVVEKDGERLILAEARVSVLGEGWKLLKKISGKELAGLQYIPLYKSELVSDKSKNIYVVVEGDFVSTEEGTGIVHIAPAFGDDDFQISKKYDLPVLVSTNERGLMQTPKTPWDGEWFKKADKRITEDLKSRRILFKSEIYEHDYPFCWRCKNPLMYFARKAWWIDVNAVREKLLENNEQINWFPDHIKHGRFGEWLKEKKNWAFSRERYWGTPLPVWRCDPQAGGCGKLEVIGSIEELSTRAASSGNRYLMMRHGESENNVARILSSNIEKDNYGLTSNGKKQVEKTAKEILKKNIKIDLIFTSPFLRSKQSADEIARILNIDESKVEIDPRFSEINFGILSDRSYSEYDEFFETPEDQFSKAPSDGETLADVKKRVYAAILEIESRYKNKNILIVAHEDSLWMLWASVLGKDEKETRKAKENNGGDYIKNGELIELDAGGLCLPKDEKFVLDLHKPYIDKVTLKCECEGEMKRVPEVCDVWFDSGSMPFAQMHWPFDNNLEYPADYIVEAVDQTRGWFYNLLSVGTLLGFDAPYKNVISLGHVLDSNGKKMSKSLGNVADPMMLVEKYGADPARWYFFTINQPWDSKLFKEDDIKDASRRFFMILWNVLKFYKMYESVKKSASVKAPKFIINKWALIKLSEISESITKKLDAYDVVGAARDLENFVTEDISRWYVRRIRDVMKNESDDSKETAQVLIHLLSEISKLLAPFAPFISEKIWQELGGKKSVHLEDWPNFGLAPSVSLALNPSSKTRGAPTRVRENESAWLLQNMEIVRKVVGLALEARQKIGVKVRQPLNKLKVKSQKLKVVEEEFVNLVKDEVNVKEVVFDDSIEGEIELDTKITPELKEEGILRDLIREIQTERKNAALTPKDKVSAELGLPTEILKVAEKNKKVLAKETNLKSIKISEAEKTKVTFS